MTRQEFEQRTGFEPTAKEYEAIEEVYMNSELDKDAFCKAWVKMNSKRVAKAKAARKAQEMFIEKLSSNLSKGILSITLMEGDIVKKHYHDDAYLAAWCLGMDIERDILEMVADMKIGESRSFYPVGAEHHWGRAIEINLYERVQC